MTKTDLFVTWQCLYQQVHSRLHWHAIFHYNIYCMLLSNVPNNNWTCFCPNVVRNTQTLFCNFEKKAHWCRHVTLFLLSKLVQIQTLVNLVKAWRDSRSADHWQFGFECRSFMYDILQRNIIWTKVYQVNGKDEKKCTIAQRRNFGLVGYILNLKSCWSISLVTIIFTFPNRSWICFFNKELLTKFVGAVQNTV